MDKVVWVLGAGFSQPLGGPILAELFSPTSYQDMIERVPDLHRLPRDHSRAVERWALKAAIYLYNFGRRFDLGKQLAQFGEPGEQLWDDAEQFLSQLDAATSEVANADPGRLLPRPNELELSVEGKLFWRRLASHNSAQQDPEVARFIQRDGSAALLAIVTWQARRFMAAQCGAFMLAPQNDPERWDPFFAWGQDQLREGHSIVTFNYDCAVERVGGGKIHVVLDDQEPAQGKVPLFKMHGSTDWHLERLRPDGSDGKPRCKLDREDWACLKMPAANICIGSPGPSKRRIREALDPVWCGAAKAIEEADAVLFVGYRFPPTDSDAREHILGALQKNKRPLLAVHTVLGPNVDGEHSRRLRALIEARVGWRGAEENRILRVKDGGHWLRTRYHPLYSQDFVNVTQELALRS